MKEQSSRKALWCDYLGVDYPASQQIAQIEVFKLRVSIIYNDSPLTWRTVMWWRNG